MSRHVVLLRRDPSLGLALRALLHGTGRVTELTDVQAWSAMPAEGIDAVVIDLPPSRRKQAVDLVRSRFGGRLVLVLDPHDDPAAAPASHAYAMVQRPFEIVELWHLVTTDPSGSGRAGSRAAEPGDPGAPGSPEAAETRRPSAGPGVAAAGGTDRGPDGRGGPAGGVPEDAEAPAAREAAEEEGPGRAAADASTWKWRGRRYGPATAMPPDPPSGEQGSGAPPRSRAGTPGSSGPGSSQLGAQPAPEEADRRQAESRRWGALPRRSAERQLAPPPSQESTGPRPATGAAEAAEPPAAMAAGRGSDATGTGRAQSADTPAGTPGRSRRPDAESGPRPSRPEAGPAAKRRVTRPTRPPAGSTAPRRPVAPTGPGQAEGSSQPASTTDAAAFRPAPAAGPTLDQPPPASPADPPVAPAEDAAAASSAGGSDAERPSLLRRLAGRFGGRRSEPEPEATVAPTEVRSPSVPAFEPAPPSPDAPPPPEPELQGWTAPTPPKVRSAPEDHGERPADTPRPGPAHPSTPQPTGPEPAPTAPAEPVQASGPPPTRQPPPTPGPAPDPARGPAPQPAASAPPAPAPAAAPAEPAETPEVTPAARVDPATTPEAGLEAPETAPAEPVEPPAAAATARVEPAAGVPEVAASVPDDPAQAVAAHAGQDEEAEDRAEAPAAGEPGDPATVQAAATTGAHDQAAPSPGRRADPGRRPARPPRPGGLPPDRGPSVPPRPVSTPSTSGGPVGEAEGATQIRPAAPPPTERTAPPRPTAAPASGERTMPPRPAAAAPPAPSRPAGPTTPRRADPAPAAGEPAAPAASARPAAAPRRVPPDAPEVLQAAAEVADATTGPTPGTPARPPGPIPPAGAAGTVAGGILGEPGRQPAPDPKPRGRRARNLLRFTAPKRPEQTAPDAAAPDAPAPLADFDRLTQSIESVTEALGGQPLEFYERDLPQIAAAETARRVRADVVVLLLDNGEGIMEVSGGVGLTPAERRLSVEYSRDVMRELFRAGVGLIEDTDRVRGALAGIPGSRAESLVMVPLVHERLGFGVLMAGRNRSQTGVPTEVFSDAEIEVLMGFADAAAASLRTAVLLRHLKGQLRALEEDD